MTTKATIRPALAPDARDTLPQAARRHLISREIHIVGKVRSKGGHCVDSEPAIAVGLALAVLGQAYHLIETEGGALVIMKRKGAAV